MKMVLYPVTSHRCQKLAKLNSFMKFIFFSLQHKLVLESQSNQT